jgi:hypothetical protein
MNACMFDAKLASKTSTKTYNNAFLHTMEFKRSAVSIIPMTRRSNYKFLYKFRYIFLLSCPTADVWMNLHWLPSKYCGKPTGHQLQIYSKRETVFCTTPPAAPLLNSFTQLERIVACIAWPVCDNSVIVILPGYTNRTTTLKYLPATPYHYSYIVGILAWTNIHCTLDVQKYSRKKKMSTSIPRGGR